MISAFGVNHGEFVSKADKKSADSAKVAAGAVAGGALGRFISGESSAAKLRRLSTYDPVKEQFNSLMRNQKMKSALKAANKDELKNIYGTSRSRFVRLGGLQGSTQVKALNFARRNKFTAAGAGVGAILAGSEVAANRKKLPTLKGKS
jgi:hypothetical protein